MIIEDLVVSYTSKVEIPVFSYLYCDFERRLCFWVLDLRSSFSTHCCVAAKIVFVLARILALLQEVNAKGARIFKASPLHFLLDFAVPLPDLCLS